MQPREKILAGVLAAVVAVWFIGPAFKSMFIEPLNDRNDKVGRLETEVSGLELKQAQLLEATRRREEWRLDSLPPEVLAAQREYRNWLYEMAQLAGWDELEIGAVGQSSRYSAFSTISTTLQGEATLDGINQFLALMESADLVHRVSALNIECPTPDGNPAMTVSITLEGVAMTNAAERSRLFPQTLLADECSRRDEAVRVDSSAGFPEEPPFRVRINDELLDVVGMEGTEWQVERGAADTLPSEHDEAAVVELLPVRENAPGAAELALVVDRIFVLPRQPSGGRKRFAELPPAIRGRDYSTRLEVSNWDPVDGTPRFELVGGAPEGLEFNSASGTLNWELADDAELETYELKVAAYGADADAPVLEDTLDLEVRRPNRAPRLSEPDLIVAWLGRSLVFVPEVEDADLPDEQLSFSLDGDVPSDARFDRRTGEFRWTPAVTEDLGELELELTVTDSGAPPESDTVTLVLDRRDDSATYTYLVGTIVQGADQEAWLYDRATGERTLLVEGRDFQVADVRGTVEAIRVASINVRHEGALYELAVGKSLREWRLIEPAAPAERDETASPAGSSDSADSR